MSLKNFLFGSLAMFSTAAGFASSTPDAMRAASAVQLNTKYASSITLSQDANANIISFHVNGVGAGDANILLTKNPSPLTTEYTIITGEAKEGGLTTYMLPSNIATAQVIESISKDLVNSGAINVQITKQLTGRL